MNGDVIEGREGVHDCLKTWTMVAQTCGTSVEDAEDAEKYVREAHTPCPALEGCMGVSINSPCTNTERAAGERCL